MDKSERVVKMAKIGLIDDDCIEFNGFIKADRFSNGRIALAHWHWFGSQCIKAKQAFKRNVWHEILCAILKIDTDCIHKADRAASIKLASFELSDLRKWYDKNNMFAVSPRTILAKFSKKDKAEKSEFEKMMVTIEMLKKQLSGYTELTELENLNINKELDSLPRRINQKTKEIEESKAA